MDVLFDFGSNPRQRVSVVGTMTRPMTAGTTGKFDILGIRFRPGGLAAYLKLDAAEVVDERVELDSFCGSRVTYLWHRLGESALSDRVPLLSEFLLKGLNVEGDVDPWVRYCVETIELERGDVRISELETKTGMSARQLERKFKREIGVSPKTFARIERFKAVMSFAEQCSQPDWAEVAADFGYSDQPHLVREFKSFAGCTPQQHRSG